MKGLNSYTTPALAVGLVRASLGRLRVGRIESRTCVLGFKTLWEQVCERSPSITCRTWPGLGAGFGYHFDPSDAIILQVEGNKQRAQLPQLSSFCSSERNSVAAPKGPGRSVAADFRMPSAFRTSPTTRPHQLKLGMCSMCMNLFAMHPQTADTCFYGSEYKSLSLSGNLPVQCLSYVKDLAA